MVGCWGLELRAGIWAGHRLWFDDLPTTVLLKPPSPSINFLSLSIHHNDLPRGSTLNRKNLEEKMQYYILTEMWSHSFKLMKKKLSPVYYFGLQSKEMNNSTFVYIRAEKSHPLQMWGLFSIFCWLFLFYITNTATSKQKFNWKWVMARNEWPHFFFFFKFVFFLNWTYREAALTHIPAQRPPLPLPSRLEQEEPPLLSHI